MLNEEEAKAAFEKARAMWKPEDFDMVVKLTTNLSTALFDTIGKNTVQANVLLAVFGSMLEYTFSHIPHDTDRMLFLKWFTDSLNERVAATLTTPAVSEPLQ